MRVALIDAHSVASAIVASCEAPEKAKVQQMKQVTITVAMYAELTAQEMLDTNRVSNRPGPVSKRGKGKTKRW